MSYYTDNEGHRATHMEPDGSVTAGGEIGVFGEETGGYGPPQPEQYDDHGYADQEYALDEYAEQAIQNAVRDELYNNGLGDPEHFGYAREYEEVAYDPEDARLEGSIVTEEQIQGLSQLAAEHPGIGTQEALRAMRPTLQEIEDQYGRGRALDPNVVARVYEAVGGFEGRFDDAHVRESFLGEAPGQDAFT